MCNFLTKTLIALCCATFVALNFFFFLLYPSESQHFGPYFELVGLFFTIGIFVSFPVSALLGWPLYWTATKAGWVNLPFGLLSGAFVAVLPWSVLKALRWNLPSISSSGGFLALSIIAICGAVGGAMFYWLERNQKSES